MSQTEAPYDDRPTPVEPELPENVQAPLARFNGEPPEAPQWFKDAIAVEPERSRVWFRMALTDFESSDDEIRAFQHTIFTQDQPVLESQRPKRLPLDLRAELHTAADKASSAYRRYLKASGITFGVC